MTFDSGQTVSDKYLRSVEIVHKKDRQYESSLYSAPEKEGLLLKQGGIWIGVTWFKRTLDEELEA